MVDREENSFPGSSVIQIREQTESLVDEESKDALSAAKRATKRLPRLPRLPDLPDGRWTDSSPICSESKTIATISQSLVKMNELLITISDRTAPFRLK